MLWKWHLWVRSHSIVAFWVEPQSLHMLSHRTSPDQLLVQLDRSLIHSWSTVDSLEVHILHQLLCLLGLANADAMKASMERPWNHLRFSVFKLDPLFVSVSSFFSLHLEYWACTVAILILCITVSAIWRHTEIRIVWRFTTWASQISKQISDPDGLNTTEG